MGYIKNILQKKGNQVFSIHPEITVYDALTILYDKNISALMVLENDKPVGIFTERDYARKVVLKGKSSKETMIKEIMSVNLITAAPDFPIEEAMRIMTNKFIRHLPVVEENRLIGIISIGDVVKHLLEEQKIIISTLENYIKS